MTMLVVAGSLHLHPAHSRDMTSALVGLHIRPMTSFSSSASVRETLTTAEQVERLRTAGLPVSAIAEMARVERKTIYSWLDGKVVSDSNSERMAAVYDLLTEQRHPDLLNVYRYWSARMSNGRSLKELLSEDVLDHRAIRQAMSEAIPLAEKDAAREDKMRRTGPRNGLLDSV
jgi:hypothetical protein